MQQHEFTAFARGTEGRGASRRLRRSGRAPGIVYGGTANPQPIELDHNALIHALKKEAFHSSILTMKFEAAGSWYRIRIVGLDKQDEDQSWAAYPSRLGNRTVLNAWPVSDLPPTPRKGVTLVAHAWLSANVIQFDLVDPDPLKGSSLSTPEALRKTLLSHRPQAELFSPFLVCARAKVVDPS